MAGRAVRRCETRSAETIGNHSACGNFRSGTAAATSRFAADGAGPSHKIVKRALRVMRSICE